MDYVLETNSLVKRYGNAKALDGLTMRVPKGAIYGFVGRNGAGKTTLIRLICGLQLPSSGSYSIYGREFTSREISRSRRRMGAVVETPSIYLDMSARENLKQQYRVLGLPSYEGVDELLELVRLAAAGKPRGKTLSRGKKQRLGIAVALCGGPDFLILDEPTNGLDPEGIIEIRELILRLNRENQITVLISSHILDELAKLATHYGFIDGGRMVREMSAAELEAACRKCMRLEVTDTRALARALDELGAEYRILSEDTADVYERLNVSKLAAALQKEGCELVSVKERDESLESFYISIVGGAHHV